MPKRRKVESSARENEDPSCSESGAEENESLSDDASISEDEINVEFDGSSPTEDDFHGIVNLLHQLFVTLHIPAAPLVNKILEQNHIGSTIKIVDSDDNDVYGITTGLAICKEDSFFSALVDALVKKMVDQSVGQRFNAKLESKKTLFLINERFINVPAQLAAPLLASLRDDLHAMQSATGDTNKQSDLIDIEQILVICKSLQPLENPEDAYNDQPGHVGPSSQGKSKRKIKKQCRTVLESGSIPLEFVNAEEELFKQAASFVFNYSVVEATGLASGRSWEIDDHATMKPYRTILLLPFDSLDEIVNDIGRFIGT